MRHRSIAVLPAALAGLVVASIAVAGGWAQVTARDVPVDPPAGQETTIQLDVLQHAVTPVSWPGLTVVATDAATGTVVRAQAKASGPAGSYVAAIVFPSAGDWTLTFESIDLVMQGSVPLHVAPLTAAQARPGTPGAPASDMLPVVLGLLAVAVILGIRGMALRSRGASAEPRVSAGT